MTCPLCNFSAPCENNPCGLRNDGRVREQKAETLDEWAAANGRVIFRALKPRDFYPPPERGHATTPGVVTLLPRN